MQNHYALDVESYVSVQRNVRYQHGLHIKLNAKLPKTKQSNISEICFMQHKREILQRYDTRYLEKYPATVNMVYSRNFGFMTVSGYALDSAAGQGELEAVKLLIGHGANLLAGDPDYGQLPIHRACEGGHIHVVKYLLEKGSPILEGDGMGQVSGARIVREPTILACIFEHVIWFVTLLLT